MHTYSFRATLFHHYPKSPEAKAGYKMGFPYGLGNSRTILEIPMLVKSCPRSELGIPRLTSDSDHLLYNACRRKIPVPAPRDAAFPHLTSPSETDSEATPRLPRHLDHVNFQLHHRIFNPQIFGSYVQLVASFHIPTDYDSATSESRLRHLWRLS